MDKTSLEFHPIAGIFPMMEEESFARLCEDIKLNGLLEPVWLYQDKIIDGRNRFLACGVAEVEPVFRQYVGDEPVRFVVSLNLHRRHLNESQRAMVGARIATMSQGARTDLASIEAMSQPDAAHLLNVSRSAVQRAAQVLREAPPEVVAAVSNGDLAVSKAVKVLRGEITNIHVSDESYEWYTPREYIDAARQVMGGIDLDPASHPVAQEVVEAYEFYTKQEDGLVKEWSGRVWLNPPYSAALVVAFTAKLRFEFASGRVSEAILLVNNATDTEWLQALLRDYTCCFTNGRVRFWTAEGEFPGPRQGQVFVYLGNNSGRFIEVFDKFGVVVQAV